MKSIAASINRNPFPVQWPARLAWLALLSLVPLSYAMLIGSINVVVLMLAGKWLFHERLDRMRVAGMWLIALGVALAGAGA